MKNLFSIIAVAVISTLSAIAQSTLSVSVTTTNTWGQGFTGVNATGLPVVYSAVGTNLIDGGCDVQSLTFVNASANSVPVALFDAPLTTVNCTFESGGTSILRTNVNVLNAISWVAPPSTTANFGVIMHTNVLANVTKITTNYTGITTTNTFTNAVLSGFWTNLNPTNQYRRAYFVSVPANTTVTPNLGLGLSFGFGITMTNGALTPLSATTNLSVIINYTKSL